MIAVDRRGCGGARASKQRAVERSSRDALIGRLRLRRHVSGEGIGGSESPIGAGR